ncbi:hypothetical protein F4Y93_05605 [Candidatus Poribacteria bacterium]|nr:hypothetical protein [Candidatus Poribacteria bacterium]
MIRPEEVVDAKATEALTEALIEIITSGRLDHLTKANDKDAKQSDFGSLSMSRLGYYGDENLADDIFQELKSRGLAEDSIDGVSIPMHSTVRALILVLLAQILRPRGECMGLTLSPTTDRQTLVNALSEILRKPETPSPTIGDIVSFDMAEVGVDLGPVPMDEVLDFRQQHYRQHRDYIQSVRNFARELSGIPSDERKVKFEQRQEELKAHSHDLRRVYRRSWQTASSFKIGLAGAAWAAIQGDPIAGVLTALTAISGLTQDTPTGVECYSYLISAKQRF